MAVEIKVLDTNAEEDYRQLLVDAPAAMFNHSLRYRSFLQKILRDADDHYLLAYEGGELTAALPLFIKRGPLGVVVNSLPFYGSHGGVLAKPNSNASVTQALLDEFTDFCETQQAICSTLIESPVGLGKETYSNYSSDYFDTRIGQITTLPERGEGPEVEESLLSMYPQKTRNMVRKGMKGGFVVSHDGSQKTIEALHALHEENIQSVGGIAKPWLVFEAIRDVFVYDEDYRIYTATRDGEIVSALLVFYFKGMVEYFTPTTLKAYRSHQPLSLLIFTVMRDMVVERGATHWNWGGTWLSQDGVYQFKSHWGTTDYPYQYRVRVHRGPSFLRGISKADLLNGYPYFYTVPFSALE
jgi:hypothetical protein